MKLYLMPSSGNSRKILHLLRLAGKTCETVEAEPATPELAAIKATGVLPFGKMPVLVLDDGRTIPESNAILCYLGEGSRLIPADPVARAQMLAWMFWEQYVHEPAVAVRRALCIYPDRAAQATPERMADLLARGTAALAVMEETLSRQDWLLAEGPSLADICLSAYTREAPDGGFDIPPAVGRWLRRVEALG